MNLTAETIANLLEGSIEGDPKTTVNSVAKIQNASVGNLCFIGNNQYTKYLYSSKASVIIINKLLKIEKKIKATIIRVEDPYSSFSKILEIYNPIKIDKIGISKKAEICTKKRINKDVYIGAFTYIAEGVIIGKNVKIYPNCYIGENVIIGDNSILFPNTSIYHNCKIGSENIIHSGVIIGSDGFGFTPNKNNNYKKINQIGNVEILNNVEIGANTTIDRATMGSTKIKEGVKLDNLIQIAHNVTIGENTVIAAQTAIAGSTTIGKNCMIGGQVAIAGHLTIANNVKIAGKSGIASNITKKGIVVQGPMAFDIKEFQRSYIIFKKLPEIYNTLNSIKKKYNE